MPLDHTHVVASIVLGQSMLTWTSKVVMTDNRLVEKGRERRLAERLTNSTWCLMQSY